MRMTINGEKRECEQYMVCIDCSYERVCVQTGSTHAAMPL